MENQNKLASDNMDNLLEQIDNAQEEQNASANNSQSADKMKERLIQVVAGGKSKQFLGKIYNTNEIEKLDTEQLTKLYGRYEAVLGGHITKTLKQHIIYAYARGVEALCPTVSQGRLGVSDVNQMFESLNNGPFIDLALTSLTCQLYHQYGHFLAPIEAAILTSNFVVDQKQLQQQQDSYQTTQHNMQQDVQQTAEELASYQS